MWKEDDIEIKREDAGLCSTLENLLAFRFERIARGILFTCSMELRVELPQRLHCSLFQTFGHFRFPPELGRND
ncbi:hypothetical protein WN51_04864 [Melipona quadrifasciata]|uniref:Uncharacterized protein n=1 Tax=Melipona quadrifasciata TaxID=166423 RepID=A0A0N0U3S8_9HYME|nr:hypothetical protein WN51_04864 [Melipona quadrifasciata]